MMVQVNSNKEARVAGFSLGKQHTQSTKIINKYIRLQKANFIFENENVLSSCVE